MSLSQAQRWIETESPQALLLLEEFCAMNSHSKNLEGLAKMKKALIEAFMPLKADLKEFACQKNGEPLGSIITFEKRKEAPLQVLLGGHMDTVFPPSSPFQFCTNEVDKLIGPGATDMKGGLIVLLYALQAFEKFQTNQRLGWKVFINSDEELGSPGSREWMKKWAPHYDFGLLFEPSYPDGALVNERKGSVNIRVDVKGKASHAGRDFASGRSANRALVHFLKALFEWGGRFPELNINAGEIHGGTAANIVPENAHALINLRSFKQEELDQGLKAFKTLSEQIAQIEEVLINYSIQSSTPTKPLTPETLKLFTTVESILHGQGETFATRPSGGVCDGNALLEAGLPNIDTMGVIGGNMHTVEEYMDKSSLRKRAHLTLELLWKYSEGEYPELERGL